MHVIRDVSSGDWIAPRLGSWGSVGGVVGRGWPAYARVLHPVTASRVRSQDPLEVEERPSSWAEAAAATGRVLHPRVQWGALAGGLGRDVTTPEGWRIGPPDDGRLGPAALAAIVAAIGGEADTGVTAGVWNGWGELYPSSTGFGVLVAESASRAERRAAQERAEAEARDAVSEEVTAALAADALLRLPGRDYLLLRATLGELADPTWVERAGIGWRWGFGPSPALVWPDDRSWLIGTEIDFDSTLVAGDRDVVGAVLGHPALEALEVDAETSLGWDADDVNR